MAPSVLLQLFAELATIEEDIKQAGSTSKSIAYSQQRREVIGHIIDGSVLVGLAEQPGSADLEARLRRDLLYALDSHLAFPQAQIRVLLDEFGDRFADDVRSLDAAFEGRGCHTVTIEGMTRELSDLTERIDAALEATATGTMQGSKPDHDLLLRPWMDLIGLQNRALEFRSDLDGLQEAIGLLGGGVDADAPIYEVMTYGKQAHELRRVILRCGQEQLNEVQRRWGSFFQRLEARMGHLRGVVDFSNIRYSKAIQDETALLSRIFLVGVAAQLIGLTSINKNAAVSNWRFAAALALVAVFVPLMLYAATRHAWHQIRPSAETAVAWVRRMGYAPLPRFQALLAITLSILSGVLAASYATSVTLKPILRLIIPFVVSLLTWMFAWGLLLRRPDPDGVPFIVEG